MEAIILAGGKGTRLSGVLKDIPKPMADVGGRPFLAYLLDHLYTQRIEEVVLSVGYRREKIMEYFGYNYRGISLSYAVEEEPLGTGGAIRESLKLTQGETVLVLNGDTYFPADVTAMADLHRKYAGGLTIALKKMFRFDRYGAVSFIDGRIAGFAEKAFCDEGFINAGVYLFDRALTSHFPAESNFSFETGFLEPMVERLEIHPFVSDAYFVDIGIPTDYCRAQEELPQRMDS